jgi:hypothetical protein
MKTKLAIAAALAFVTAIPAQAAGVFNYACHRPDEFKLYAAKLDLAKKTITWNGVVYRNMKSVYADEYESFGCAKACFEATNPGGKVRLDTATQGVASLTVSFGRPGSDGVDELECDVVRGGRND